MVYLLIVFILLVALAPLAWVKASPRQQQIAVLRRVAASRGLQVSLSHPPDAREGQGRLEQVRYCLPWPLAVDDSKRPAPWLLLHNSRRGDASPWQHWSWLQRPKSPAQQAGIAAVIEVFSEDVSGLACNADGLQFYWQEKDSAEQLGCFIDALESLQKSLCGL